MFLNVIPSRLSQVSVVSSRSTSVRCMVMAFPFVKFDSGGIAK